MRWFPRRLFFEQQKFSKTPLEYFCIRVHLWNTHFAKMHSKLWRYHWDKNVIIIFKYGSNGNNFILLTILNLTFFEKFLNNRYFLEFYPFFNQFSSSDLVLIMQRIFVKFHLKLTWKRHAYDVTLKESETEN